ncbi:DUF3238 domain-containing protein [Bacillus sp. JJ1122]|uniref:DUF3238 domain-containing protein n=1 Tax=Bacillus sp. JJ1122 TaxID=3122951 RepID=UPI002FFEDC99
MKSDNPILNTSKMSKRILPLAAIGIAGALYAASVNRRRKTASISHSRIMDLIEQQPTCITIAWPESHGRYRVYRDHKLIYNGPATKLMDRNLIPGTLYTYSIEKMDGNDHVEEILKIQTRTEVDYKERENALQDLIMTSVVANNQVSLEWEPIEGVSEYTIFKNGVKMKTIDCCSYIDDDLESDEEIIYTIKAKRPLQRSDQIKWEIKSVVAHAVGAIKKDSSTEMAAKEEFSITKKIGPLNQLLKPVGAISEGNKERLWQLRYTTFLNEEWLQNPNPASADHYFKGDNRSFDPESSKFRTRADVFIDSENPSALLSKEVGKTEAFNKKEEFIEEADASDEGIKLKKVFSDDDKIMFQLHHSISNPLVMSPAIDYIVCGTFYKDGQFDLVGLHDQAPHHEIYLKAAGTEDWQPIHQAESKGLEMMASTLANQYWRYSTFTS